MISIDSLSLSSLYGIMKFKCKLVFLIIIAFLFGSIFYRINYVRKILENNHELELGLEIKFPQIIQSPGSGFHKGHFNATEFIKKQKGRGNHSLRFESGKPSLSKSKIFEKRTFLAVIESKENFNFNFQTKYLSGKRTR